MNINLQTYFTIVNYSLITHNCAPAALEMSWSAVKLVATESVPVSIVRAVRRSGLSERCGVGRWPCQPVRLHGVGPTDPDNVLTAAAVGVRSLTSYVARGRSDSANINPSNMMTACSASQPPCRALLWLSDLPQLRQSSVKRLTSKL